MIEKEYVVTMARYNAWQNKQITDILNVMNEEEIWRDRGGFFGSIMHTLSHLLWGDTLWMSRWCDDVQAPHQSIAESVGFCETFGDWQAQRFQMDGRIRIWSETLSNVDLKGTLAWFSGALGRDVEEKRTLCITHMFNHQTHHRGQIHAMLTAAGLQAPVTDLFIMPEHI